MNDCISNLHICALCFTCQLPPHPQDVNDECPIFDPAHYDNINILENTAAGHVVTRLMASDADQSGTPQSTLAFYIKSNTGRGLFNANEDTGVVTILNPPDFEEIHQITASVSRGVAEDCTSTIGYTYNV